MSLRIAKIDLYLLKTAMTPLSISLFVAALLLILEQMLRLLDFVLNENGPVDVVWKMLAFLVPHYLSLALPISLFLGVVLAFRKLSLSSEMDSMLATGMSPWRLLRPLLFLTAAMMALNFLLLAYIQPYAQYGFHQLRYELQAGLLGARVPVGSFVSIAEDVRLRIGETRDNGNLLVDLFVDYKGNSGVRSTFTAKTGQFVQSSDPDVMLLRLFNGRQMILQPDQNVPGVLDFDQQDIKVDLPRVTNFRERGGEKREATFDELIQLLADRGSTDQTTWDEYRASLHFRLIHTVTFLALPFLALATGISNRRRPSNSGPIVGIAIVVVYHELLEEWAEGKVALEGVSPYFVMWPLYMLFTAFALFLYVRLSEKPGTSSGTAVIDESLKRVYFWLRGMLEHLPVRSHRRRP